MNSLLQITVIGSAIDRYYMLAYLKLIHEEVDCRNTTLHFHSTIIDGANLILNSIDSMAVRRHSECMQQLENAFN
jgi:hypothetical protein